LIEKPDATVISDTQKSGKIGSRLFRILPEIDGKK